MKSKRLLMYKTKQRIVIKKNEEMHAISSTAQTVTLETEEASKE
jgi:hypothetical protein